MYAHGIRPNAPSRVSSIPRLPTINPHNVRQLQEQFNASTFNSQRQYTNQPQTQSQSQSPPQSQPQSNSQIQSNNNYENLLNQFNEKLQALEKSHQIQTQQTNEKIDNLNSQISKLELGFNNISNALTNIVEELEKTEDDLVTTNNLKTRIIVEEDTDLEVNIPNQYIVTPDDLSDTD